MKITKEIREKLREPFPPEAISQHPTKKFLSTIKAIYITERLNDIFGICGWNLEHEIISDTEDYVSVKGRIVVPATEPYKLITPYQYGGHKKTGKNTEPADGYKSAMTDCQSKCASYLEIGIDVFKGLVSSKSGTTTTGTKKEMSVKQWNYAKKIAADLSLTEDELIDMIKWKGEKENIEPKSWKMSKLIIPKKNMELVLSEYSEFQMNRESKKEVGYG